MDEFVRGSPRSLYVCIAGLVDDRRVGALSCRERNGDTGRFTLSEDSAYELTLFRWVPNVSITFESEIGWVDAVARPDRNDDELDAVELLRMKIYVYVRDDGVLDGRCRNR